MNITFKQGIIKYPASGSLQSFLQKNGTDVNLLADNGSTLINFAHGDSNYIFEEFSTISQAWLGPFNPGSDYWLYWDIDTLTGIRTFGHTILAPLISSNKPSSPQTGQHWYDLANNKMFVWETSIWRNVIRVFSAYYNGLDFSSMGIGIGSFPYAGSQVGISSIIGVSGKILFNDDNKPALKLNREFYTSESVFNVNGTNIDTLRLESLYNIAKTNETLPKYHVVTYVDDGIVELANYNNTTSIIAMVTEDANINQTANIILSGIITNLSWNFTETIGSPLWVSQNGEMVNADPHLTDNISNPKQYPPVAKVLSPNSIIFEPTYQTDAEINITLTPATVNELGVVKLTTPAVNSFQPVVVSDTDPRLIDDRNPLPHIHDALDVTFTSTSGLSSLNVQNGLDELNVSKANLSGATFTGSVSLNSDPTTNLEAATKQYVDALIAGLTWIDPIQFINVIGDTILTDPANPNLSDTYIIPNTGTPLNNWSTFINNDIIQWDGIQWNLLDNLTNITSSKFGISLTSNTVPFGTFVGQTNNIATYDGTWSFITPTSNDAVLVNNPNDYHSYHQFVFDTKWIEYAGPHSLIPGKNLFQNTNILNVKDVADGGTIDALTLDGNSATDFVAVNGDIMTGILTLSGDPTSPLEAATKQYVDGKASSLPELTDVDNVLAPVNNDVLYFDSISGLWKSKQIISTPVTSSSGSPYTFTNLFQLIDTGWKLKIDALPALATNTEITELSLYSNGVILSDISNPGTAFASTISLSDIPDNAFDNNNNTNWASTGIVGEYVGKILSSPINPNMLRIVAGKIESGPIGFTLEKSTNSTDGINGIWNQVLTTSNNQPWYIGETRDFPLTPALNKLDINNKASFMTLPIQNDGLYAYWSTGATAEVTASTTNHATGKYYLEYVAGSSHNGPANGIGIFNSISTPTSNVAPFVLALSDTTMSNNGSTTFSALVWDVGEIIGVEIDLDTGVVIWRSLLTGATATLTLSSVGANSFHIGVWGRFTSSVSINFGAIPFKGTIPAGYTSWDGNIIG